MTDPRHGTVAGYNRIPCREACCRKAMATYKQLWHLDQMRGADRLIPAIGAQRRVQALACLGWPNAEVARRAGMHPEHLPRIVLRAAMINRKTHDRIAAAYEQMSMTLPTGNAQVIAATRNRAARNGWLPPLAWDDIDRDKRGSIGHKHKRSDVDEAVVLRILAGERLSCTPAEKREVLRRWGGSMNELGRLTGWNVDRYKEAS